MNYPIFLSPFMSQICLHAWTTTTTKRQPHRFAFIRPPVGPVNFSNVLQGRVVVVQAGTLIVLPCRRRRRWSVRPLHITRGRPIKFHFRFASARSDFPFLILYDGQCYRAALAASPNPISITQLCTIRQQPVLGSGVKYLRMAPARNLRTRAYVNSRASSWLTASTGSAIGSRFNLH